MKQILISVALLLATTFLHASSFSFFIEKTVGNSPMRIILEKEPKENPDLQILEFRDKEGNLVGTFVIDDRNPCIVYEVFYLDTNGYYYSAGGWSDCP